MIGLRFLKAAAIIAALCVPVFSQMPLSSFYSRGVSSGKWSCTKMDSVMIDTRVNNGVATTVLTLTLTPDTYRYCESYMNYTDTIVVPIKDTAKINAIMKSGTNYLTYTNYPDTNMLTIVSYTSGYTCLDAGEIIDSVEISGSMYLPSDFVAKNLYLWVGNERQTGYIQDRAIRSWASAETLRSLNSGETAATICAFSRRDR
jgi:hypothetical protein